MLFMDKINCFPGGHVQMGSWAQEEVANIFKEVLQKYNGMFHTIVFAILEVNKKDYIV